MNNRLYIANYYDSGVYDSANGRLTRDIAVLNPEISPIAEVGHVYLNFVTVTVI